MFSILFYRRIGNIGPGFDYRRNRVGIIKDSFEIVISPQIVYFTFSMSCTQYNHAE